MNTWSQHNDYTNLLLTGYECKPLKTFESAVSELQWKKVDCEHTCSGRVPHQLTHGGRCRRQLAGFGLLLSEQLCW